MRNFYLSQYKDDDMLEVVVDGHVIAVMEKRELVRDAKRLSGIHGIEIRKRVEKDE